MTTKAKCSKIVPSPKRGGVSGGEDGAVLTSYCATCGQKVQQHVDAKGKVKKAWHHVI